MLLAPKYTGLELPVYDADTPVLNADGLRGLAQRPHQPEAGERIVRAIRARLNADCAPENVPDNLNAFLDIADQELATVAELCKGRVVDYQWGLLPDPDQRYNRFNRISENLHHIVPAGHVLVAEVEVLKGAISLFGERRGRFAPTYQTAQAGLDAYLNREEGYELADMGEPQFVVQAARKVAGLEPRPILVDIEPRLAFIG